MRSLVPFTLLLALGIVAPTGAQSLADVAKREAERRAKSASGAVKSYTNRDLASAEEGEEPTGSAAAERSSTPGGHAQRASSPDTGSSAADEAYWRSRAESARSRVKSAQEKVARLEGELRRAGGASPGPLPGACAEGRVQTGAGLTGKSYRVCDPNVLQAQEGQRVNQELERAQEDLARARAALEALPREARRAGALPGWVR